MARIPTVLAVSLSLTLEHTRLADGTVRAVRGAGVKARIDAITDEPDAR
jgi:hypothetical protein